MPAAGSAYDACCCKSRSPSAAEPPLPHQRPRARPPGSSCQKFEVALLRSLGSQVSRRPNHVLALPMLVPVGRLRLAVGSYVASPVGRIQVISTVTAAPQLQRLRYPGGFNAQSALHSKHTRGPHTNQTTPDTRAKVITDQRPIDGQSQSTWQLPPLELARSV